MANGVWEFRERAGRSLEERGSEERGQGEVWGKGN